MRSLPAFFSFFPDLLLRFLNHPFGPSPVRGTLHLLPFSAIATPPVALSLPPLGSLLTGSPFVVTSSFSPFGLPVGLLLISFPLLFSLVTLQERSRADFVPPGASSSAVGPIFFSFPFFPLPPSFPRPSLRPFHQFSVPPLRSPVTGRPKWSMSRGTSHFSFVFSFIPLFSPSEFFFFSYKDLFCGHRVPETRRPRRFFFLLISNLDFPSFCSISAFGPFFPFFSFSFSFC